MQRLRLFFLFLIAFQPGIGNAQTDTSYFDKEWNEVARREDAYYFRLPVKKLDYCKYEVKDFFLSNGQIQMIATYRDSSAKIEEGRFISYYENGNKQSESRKVNNLYHGWHVTYHENGTIASEGNCRSNKREGEWKLYYKTGEQKAVCTYQNDYVHGYDTYFFKTKAIKRKDRYRHGKLISKRCFNTSGDDTTYYPDRSTPRFPGDDKDYDRYILKRTNLRGHWKKHRIKGSVIVHAYFDEKGKIYAAVFWQRKEPAADEEAMRIIMNMPNWEPAEDEEGNPIKSELALSHLVFKTKFVRQ